MNKKDSKINTDSKGSSNVTLFCSGAGWRALRSESSFFMKGRAGNKLF